MHNVEKWPKIHLNVAVATLQDFKSMFGHFSTLYIKKVN